jgi:hypothetical protein
MHHGPAFALSSPYATLSGWRAGKCRMGSAASSGKLEAGNAGHCTAMGWAAPPVRQAGVQPSIMQNSLELKYYVILKAKING